MKQIENAHARYMGEPAGSSGRRFSRLLRQLGISLPSGLDLRRLRQLGWLQPVLRVELPQSFFVDWTNYPNYPREGQLQPEHHWAARLWDWCSFSDAVGREHQDCASRHWYVHRLDEPADPVTKLVRSNELHQGDKSPPPVEHPSDGRLILPWIDFFAYWQAYELEEILNAARLPIDAYYGRDVGKDSQELVGVDLPRLVHLAERQIQSVQERWLSRERVFDCISRYRTLLGIWASGSSDVPGEGLATDRNEAARSLAADLGLSAEELREEIRGQLLILWKQGRIHRPRLRELLREDVWMALSLLCSVTGRPLDWEDPLWRADHEGPKIWASLEEVLPYEILSVQRNFPALAIRYLQPFNRVVAVADRIIDDEVLGFVRCWSSESVPFRGMMVAFNRYEDQYSGMAADGRFLNLLERDPMSYLKLCALQAEQLVVETLDSSGGISPLVLSLADKIARRFRLSNQSSFRARLKARIKDGTKLHTLPEMRTNPFKEPADGGHSEGREDFFARTLVNFTIMRNYAAHHDCIDRELLNQGWINAGIEAIIVVMVSCMLVRKEPNEAAGRDAG